MALQIDESGCGKKTLLHIMKRFYPEESGDLLLNGSLKLADIPIHEWRECIASVPQEIKIFNAPLLQNISLREMSTPEEIEKVVEFCNEIGLAPFFESFPQGYATLLGEEGVNISGGQKQLVALARALYQKPQLLLLDEPTSAMDRETEQNVLGLLNRLRDHLAVMMVTHRVQSIKHADRIYILEGGVVQTSGDSAALMESENLFSKTVEDVLVENY